MTQNIGAVLFLPRVYSRGPPPKIFIPDSLMDIVSPMDGLKDEQIAHKLLEELYLHRKYSASKIARIFNVQTDTVRRWLERLKIRKRKRTDVLSDSLTKYPKYKFSGSHTEKAYLLGLRTGDIAVQKHGRGFRVSVTTSHPAMLALFCESFGKYNKVGLYPKKDNLKGGYYWSAYCDLHKSFVFLHKKLEIIPSEVIRYKDLFLSYLAGYFDAEGCISIYWIENNGGNISFILKSCDKAVLIGIVKGLNRLGFNLSIRLAKQADGISYSKDYWSAITSQKLQVLELLNKLDLRHKEKLQKRDLAVRMIEKKWNAYNEEISKLKANISQEVFVCRKSAALGTKDRISANKELKNLLDKCSRNGTIDNLVRI